MCVLTVGASRGRAEGGRPLLGPAHLTLSGPGLLTALMEVSPATTRHTAESLQQPSACPHCRLAFRLHHMQIGLNPS